MAADAERSGFAAMHGGDVLAYLRDTLLRVIDRRRTFIRDSRAISGGSTDRDLLRELVAMEAAADCLTYAIGAGLLAKSRGRAVPDWVLEMSNQARAALHVPDAEP